MLDLNTQGAYCRTAGGNLQRPDDQKQAVKWMAWSLNKDNGGNGGAAVWDLARQLWKNAGIADFPWMHVRSMEDLTRLISVAEGKDSPAIGVNIEDIVGDHLSLKEVGGYLLDFWVNRYQKPVHMPTLTWVQNGQGWQYVGFANIALEIFIGEGLLKNGYDAKIVNDSIKHAYDEGCKNVTLMFGTKAQSPASYGAEWEYCHSLYTADDIPPSASGWKMWEQIPPCKGTAPPEEPQVPITVAKFPFTGPLYGPSHIQGPSNNKSTNKGLKRAMIRLRYLDQPLGSETDDFGLKLEEALKVFQKEEGISPATGQYGRGTWMLLRYARLTQGPNEGQYAMDALALRYVREDVLKRCYPHPVGALSEVCQDLHQTDGLLGNWAIDFCAPGGTKVVAVERATIKKLSGHDPAEGADNTIGIFGWSIHYETADGYRYFSTHYGARANLSVGQIVDVGQVVGTVGHWPGNPPRSHTHLGVTSPLGTADAKKRITFIKNCPRVIA